MAVKGVFDLAVRLGCGGKGAADGVGVSWIVASLRLVAADFAPLVVERTGDNGDVILAIAIA